MMFVVHMLARTPPYVFVQLAYLVWQGVRSLRTRQQSVWRMLIVPAFLSPLVFCCWSSGHPAAFCQWRRGSSRSWRSCRWDL
jgi:hypothetical protein